MLEANFVWRGAFYKYERESLYTPEFYNQVRNSNPWRGAVAAQGQIQNLSLDDQVQMGDLRGYLLDLYLVKADRTSMAHALELRPALLDPELAELVFQIPEHHKIRRFQTKWILRKIMKTMLPESILNAPKQGFTPPLSFWLQEDASRSSSKTASGRPLSRSWGSSKPEK